MRRVLPWLVLGLLATAAPADAQDAPRRTLELAAAGPFAGSNQAPRAGTQVVALGDLDGDGDQDLAVTTGAPVPSASNGRPEFGLRVPAQTEPNTAFLLAGPVASAPPAPLVARPGGRVRTADGVAPQVFPAGDLDADGRRDLVVVANRSAWIVWGVAEGLPMVTLDPGAPVSPGASRIDLGAGWARTATAVGDLDGDGRDDLALGLPVGTALQNSPGAVAVVHGTAGRPTGALVPETVLGGLPAGSGLGSGVAGPGDLDADGFDDLAVSSSTPIGADARGGVWVFRGGPQRGAFDLSAGGDRVRAVATPGVSGAAAPRPYALGDVSGDGLPDLGIDDRGARPVTGRAPGRVSVVFGRSPLPDRDLKHLGTDGITLVAATQLVGHLGGAGLAPADVDGDGRPEVIAGAVIPDGTDLTVEALVALRGTVAPAPYAVEDGRAVAAIVALRRSAQVPALAGIAAVGDQDGDGVGDLLIGLPTGDGVTCREPLGKAALVPGRLAALPTDEPNADHLPLFRTGTAGSDRFMGRGGADVLDGGPGEDCLNGGRSGMDRLIGGEGNDELVTAAMADRLEGGPGNDVLRDVGEEPSGRDVLLGGPGNDLIRHGGAQATIDAGPGDDNVRDGGSSVVRLGAGDDRYNGSIRSVRDVRRVLGGPHRVDGGPGEDEIRGGQKRDVLRGGTGADVLEGRGGPDTLIGGPGRDVLRGGTGADRIDAVDGERDVVYCDRRDRIRVDRTDRLVGCTRARGTTRFT